MDGFEADDLIATYAKMALDDGMEVVVVSGDKDLMQLIRPGVEFYDPMKDKFFTAEDVKEKFGFIPTGWWMFRPFRATAPTMCRGSRHRSQNGGRVGQCFRFVGTGAGTCRRNQTEQTPRSVAGQP